MEPRVNRKDFLKTAARFAMTTGSLSTLPIIIQSCSDSPKGITDRDLRFSNFEEADREIEKLSKVRKIVQYGDWSPFQILVHCAESIEYSIKGFPENKSALFQSTIGKMAFTVFSIRGKMSHDLNAQIPGAPELPKTGTLEDGILALRKSFEAFINHKTDFAPHFAYGKLSKQEYELAHAIHIANHLSFLKFPD
ncbi:four helix bundle metalloprotein [Leptospira inadai serovar Lyme str. 10]|uniref:Four helix bundle metalloprotein n=2 Tax=Leptospira inadai serovar Lyme TaxID=293084 RepID=V6H8K7_9LEPT|nr:DUF1569 domain-containing protein [Leptospira inadai]EQA35087.1 four helix bundle metalloprotein [Leptospira inadai serovar Lyme str. 10]PNV75403.1 DUF1569 domain-containing protein [Leptospira inadai serovar Lyme]